MGLLFHALVLSSMAEATQAADLSPRLQNSWLPRLEVRDRVTLPIPPG
jgi:hypothetical protein